MLVGDYVNSIILSHYSSQLICYVYLQVYRELGNFPTRKIYERIHVNGCVTVILASLENYVMPLLLAWALIGESVSHVLSSSSPSSSGRQIEHALLPPVALWVS